MRIFLAFEHKPLWFTNPHDVISCQDYSVLGPVFQKMERWLDAGWYVAGFLSYEAGYGFEKCFSRPQNSGFPLLAMGAYRQPTAAGFPWRPRGAYELLGFRLTTPFSQYAGNIQRIRTYIAQGDVYQITYCIKHRFHFRGDPQRLFSDLYHYQPVPYSAYIETADFHILSLSPERFIRKKGSRALAEPMKGTWRRGSSASEDRRMRSEFSHDPKNLSENVMIADLLRNDLGRIGTGIQAPKLFTITPYKTLYQMTSTITGTVPKAIRLYELFAALFPSGSVTGAPKIRAMQIIREIEKEDRKIYTGAIGYIAPNRDLYFNVPIRTLLIQGTSGEMGVGGGIVWDSTPDGEWEESQLKSRFLQEICVSNFVSHRMGEMPEP